MLKVLIVGAGSIGNHLAHACRNQNWEVHITDIDQAALERMRREIYPVRYGAWDAEIVQHSHFPEKTRWDAVIVGTPPDTHIRVAIEVLSRCQTGVLLIEKPLTVPGCNDVSRLETLLKLKKVRGLVGFNHNVTANTLFMAELVAQYIIGRPTRIEVDWLESWEGIFAAHPWLNGPADSYLGYQARGGGALCEHSHAIAMWLHLVDLLDIKESFEFTASAKMLVADPLSYDQETQVSMRWAGGLVGRIRQDVSTFPAVKRASIIGESGYIQWATNEKNSVDVVRWSNEEGRLEVKEFPKTRPDDFVNEVKMIETAVKNQTSLSTAIDFSMGLRVARFTDLIIESAKTGATQISTQI